MTDFIGFVSILGLTTLLATSCGAPVPGPSASGEETADAGQGQGQGDAAQAEPDRWTVQFEVPASEALSVSVQTSESCCGEEAAEAAGSPARVYLAPEAGGAGYLLFLGKGDATVLAAQTGPGAYDEVLHRSTTAATRDGDVVELSLPFAALPGGDLRIWAATRFATTVGGQALALKLDDGTIPCAIVHTGRPGQDPRAASGAPEPPAGLEPASGDPTKAAGDGSVAPPPGLEPGSGDPGKEPDSSP